MNCAQVRLELPALLVGEMNSEDTDRLRRHLDHCSECRHEYEALQSVCRSLDADGVPDIKIDLPRLYRQESERLRWRMRCWRRTAAITAAAAVALIAAGLALRLEMRLEPHQVVVRWGTISVASDPAPP